MQVLGFVLDAVRAEAFNEARTLFLFGSYTIGKEKLFLEVARTLKQKVTLCCLLGRPRLCLLHCVLCDAGCKCMTRLLLPVSLPAVNSVTVSSKHDASFYSNH